MFDCSSIHLVEFEVTIAEIRNACETIVTNAGERKCGRARNCSRFRAPSMCCAPATRDAATVAECVVNNAPPQLIDL
jgi:hypothetical protein